MELYWLTLNLHDLLREAGANETWLARQQEEAI